VKREYEGYLTVYVALMLGIIVSLIITMLCGIRIHTIRFESECVMDLALESIFAEFHKEMAKQYGLLFIDSSYGSENAKDEYTASHLLYYLNSNFEENGKSPFYIDLTDIQADNAVIYDIAYASDNKGEVLRYEIGNYIFNELKMPLKLFSGADNVASKLEEYDDYASWRRGAISQVDGIMEEINSNLDEDEEAYSISNPADSVEEASPSNILYYAIGDKSIDSVHINTMDYISNRSHGEGSGLRNDQNENSILEKPFYIEYMLRNCGFYDQKKTGSMLNYEIEYILKGKDSDMKNLEAVAMDIFMTRYVINMQYLLSSGSKQEEAEALASLATAVILLPELMEAVKYTILFAWGYAESAKDMRILFDGNKLPLLKNDDSWNTPLSQMVDFKAHLDEYSSFSGDVGYRDYLFTFLGLESKEKSAMRLMDIMEMDIRMTPGNSNFKMDGMIYRLSTEANFSSGYGYGCNIVRHYAYE